MANVTTAKLSIDDGLITWPATTMTGNLNISYDGAPKISFTDAGSHVWSIGTKNGDNFLYIIDGSSNDIVKFGVDNVQFLNNTQVILTGDQSAIRHKTTNGTDRFLVGLRTDLHADDFVFHTYGGDWNFRNGKVGIGISPTYLTHIYGAEAGEGTALGQLAIQSSTAYGSTPDAGIIFLNQHTSGSQAIMGGIKVTKTTTGDGNYSGTMTLQVRNHGAVAYDAMTILNTGNVGIGTANPIPMTHIMANATTGTVPYPLLALELADGGADTAIGEGPAINFYIPDTTTSSVGAGTIYAQKGAGSSHLAGQIATVRISTTDALGSGDMTFSTAENANALAEKMRITWAGNVGIGTTAPAYALDVQKPSGTVPRIRVKSAGSDDAHIIVDGANNDYIILSRGGTAKYAITNNYATGTDSFSIYDYPANIHRLVIRRDTDGRVGINTASPSDMIHVHNPNSTSGTSYTKYTNTATGSGSGDGIVLGMGSSISAYLWNRENGHLYFGTNNTSRMWISNGGIVSVQGQLRVGTSLSTADAHIELGYGRTGNGYSYFDLIGDATYTDYGLRLIRNNTGANSTSFIYHRGTGSLTVSTVEAAHIYFNTTSANRMSINADGNATFGHTNLNGIRYFDIWNNNASGSGGEATDLRLITRNAANSADAIIDHIKYRNGLYLIHNSEPSSAGSILFRANNNNGLSIDNTGNGGEVRIHSTDFRHETHRMHRTSYARAANGSQARRSLLLEFTYNSHHWDSGGPFFVTLAGNYYNGTNYQKYMIMHTYTDTSPSGAQNKNAGDALVDGSADFVAILVETTGNISNYFKLHITGEFVGVEESSYSVAKCQVYVDVDYYAQCYPSVEVLSGTWNQIATSASWTTGDQYKFYEVPSNSNISAFRTGTETPQSSWGMNHYGNGFFGSGIYNWEGTQRTNYDQYGLIPSSTGNALNIAGTALIAGDIKLDGKLGIGTDDPDYDIEVEVAGAEVFVHYNNNSRGGLKALSTQRVALMSTSVNDNIVFGYADASPANDGSDFTERFKIDNGTGNISGTHGTYHSASDQRLKENIITIPNALDKVTSLRGVNFTWKDPSEGTGTKMGLIAQEVEEVVPEVVHTQDTEDSMKAVEYQYLAGLFVEAIKELKEEIEELKKRII